MVDATEDVFRLTQERAAGICQRDVMTAPIEQRDANLHLELADLLAERRVRRVQPGRGAREIQFFGHRHEVPQMPHPDRLDGAAKNRNPGAHAVSREASYEDGHCTQLVLHFAGGNFEYAAGNVVPGGDPVDRA